MVPHIECGATHKVCKMKGKRWYHWRTRQSWNAVKEAKKRLKRERKGTHEYREREKELKRAKKEYKSIATKVEMEKWERFAEQLEDQRKQNPHMFWKLARRVCGAGPDRELPKVMKGSNGMEVEGEALVVQWAEHFKTLSTINRDTQEFDLLFLQETMEEMNGKKEREENERMAEREENGGGNITVTQARTVTPNEITLALAKLKERKATGPDDVPAEALKRGGTGMTRCLARLFSLINNCECVPTQWKLGEIVPLFKGGKKDPMIFGSYRGITLNSIVGKVMEMLMLKQLENWERDSSALHTLQFGFRKGRGCNEAVWTLSEIVRRRQKAGQNTIICTIDFAKAFDTVWVDGLLKILHDRGVTGRLWRLIKEWYDGAKSRVRVSGNRSQPFEVTQGVRQGAILSPFLFNLWVRELMRELEGKGAKVKTATNGIVRTHWVGALTYADDMTLLAGSNVEVKEMLQIIEEWARKYRMKINEEKCEIIHLRPSDNRAPRPQPNTHINASVNGRNIQNIEEFRFLGFQVKRDGRGISWDSHWAKQRNSVVGEIGALSGGFGQKARASVATMSDIAESRIKSRLTHGAEVATVSVAQGKKLDAVGRKVGKIALGVRTSTANGVVCGELGWSTIQDLIKSRKLAFAAKLHRSTHIEGVLFRDSLKHWDNVHGKWWSELKSHTNTLNINLNDLRPHSLFKVKADIKSKAKVVEDRKWKDSLSQTALHSLDLYSKIKKERKKEKWLKWRVEAHP